MIGRTHSLNLALLPFIDKITLFESRVAVGPACSRQKLASSDIVTEVAVVHTPVRASRTTFNWAGPDAVSPMEKVKF